MKLKQKLPQLALCSIALATLFFFGNPARAVMPAHLWCEATLESIAATDRLEDVDFKKLREFFLYYPAEKLPQFRWKNLKLVKRRAGQQVDGVNTAEARVYKNKRGKKFYVKFALTKEEAIEEAKYFMLLNKYEVGLRFRGTVQTGDRWGIATDYVEGVNTKTIEFSELKELHQSALDDIARDSKILHRLRLDGYDLQFLITEGGRHAVLLDPQRYSLKGPGFASLEPQVLKQRLKSWFPEIRKD